MSARDRERAADAVARRAAQTHFSAPLVLEAGAGTGKTTVLIARVLAWCLGAGWERTEQRLGAAGSGPERIAEQVLERVVAITFTEAAAAEMESRALAAFAAIARGEAVPEFDTALPGVAPGDLQRRAHALLAAFDQLRFQTIHAFCRRLLAAHPLEAGLHPRFTVDARGSARAAVVRESLEAHLRAIRESGDPDLEVLLLEGVGAPELERVLDALAAAAVPARAFAADPLAPERVRAWVAALRDAAAAFAVAEAGRLAALKASATGKGVADAVAATCAATAHGAEKADELVALVESLRASWTDKEVERLGLFAAGRFNQSERAALGADVAPLAAAAERLYARVAGLDQLDPARLAVLHRVLAPLVASVEQRLAEIGAESFDALLRRSRDLLARHPAVADAVRSEIDQLLVDEFQDTDRVQCEIVSMLALAGAERPGLFLVGDPKQSVYGWRNADVGAYMRFVERACEVPGAERHSLCVNHRSVPAVLDEVERVVAPVMGEVPGVQPPFQPLLAAEARVATVGSGTPGLAAVEYWWSDRWDAASGRFAATSVAEAAALEARELAADLLRLAARGVAWKQVGVLLRSTGELDRYLAALRDAEIPYLVDRDRSYYQRREVRDAAATVCTVLDANDQVALVATLRSAWVGVPDAAWRPLWARDFPLVVRGALDRQPGALDRVRAIAGAVAREIAAVPGIAALAGWDASLVHAVEVLADLRRRFATEPVDGFVEALRVSTLVEATEAARYPGGFRLANLARFFRELQALLEEHSGDVASVLRALRADATASTDFYEGRPEDPDEDAVRVMTIHGAKGLDFEHVYVMQLHKGSGAGAAAFSHELDGDRVEWRLALPRLRAASLGWADVAARRAHVERAESVRTLYVALTRAKSRVVLAGRFDAGERGTATHAGWLWRSRGTALAEARDRLLAARAAGAAASEDAADGARVRWLAFTADETPCGAARPVRAEISVERVVEESARLATLDAEARRRAQRRRVGRASEHVADAQREHRAAGWQTVEAEGRERRDGEAEIAAAVGTALHALLERYDWNAIDPAAEWAARVGTLHQALDGLAEPARDAARTRATALLAALRPSALWEALRSLAAHTLARELPVLLGGDTEDSGPVGCLVGAIDWIYWDSTAGEAVVVDFKTDRVDSADDLTERRQRHRLQAERYRRAAQQSLGLARPPRVELWFLAAGRREVVELERSRERPS